MSEVHLMAVLGILENHPRRLHELRLHVWRQTRHYPDPPELRGWLTGLMAAGWVARNGIWYRLTDQGQRAYGTHKPQAVPA